MSAPKHTPGPWYSEGYGVYHRATTLRAGSRLAVVDWRRYKDGAPVRGQQSTVPSNEAVANAARIVACVNALEGINPEAVPEMLEALRWIRDKCTGLPAVARALAEKAIAKAEGR